MEEWKPVTSRLAVNVLIGQSLLNVGRQIFPGKGQHFSLSNVLDGREILARKDRRMVASFMGIPIELWGNVPVACYLLTALDLSLW